MGVRLSATPFAAEPETRPCGALIDAGTACRKTDFAQCHSSRRKSVPAGDPSQPAMYSFDPPAAAWRLTKLLIRLDNGGWPLARGAQYRPPDEAVQGLPTNSEPRGCRGRGETHPRLAAEHVHRRGKVDAGRPWLGCSVRVLNDARVPAEWDCEICLSAAIAAPAAGAVHASRRDRRTAAIKNSRNGDEAASRK